MPTMTLTLAAGLGLMVGFLLGRWWAPSAGDPAAREALADHERFLEHLRETTWEHRDLAPELSTIVLDEIRTFHRGRGLEGPH